jgi:pyruvate,orthophosphate dikinase
VAFGGDLVADPSDADPVRVGAKAAGLITMSALGLPVPPGVVLAVGVTEGELDGLVRVALDELERTTARRVGDAERPLLVSVRSGAARSMPGMLDTLLDVGITPAVVAGLARATGDASFAEDTRRRFVSGWAEVVGAAPPDDPVEQVVEAARAVLSSWNGERAQAFSDAEGRHAGAVDEAVDETAGTSITIQAMVFGNLGADSGTGVVFSRDPSTGAAGMVGDLLVGAQGGDVVGGSHMTSPLSELAQRWPAVHRELVAAVEALERHHADMVDVEFTVEDGRLFLLQCRPGRRTPAAAARIAVEMAEDPSIPLDRSAAVSRCRHLLDRPAEGLAADSAAAGDPDVLARGLAASPGTGSGVLVVSVDEALRRADAGEPVVLARPSTSPSDVAGMAVARGIVTSRGGIVSHAAVVARSWGLPAVVGATELAVTEHGIVVGARTVAEGETVTVDGDAGVLLVGAQSAAGVDGSPELELLRRWASELDEP